MVGSYIALFEVRDGLILCVELVVVIWAPPSNMAGMFDMKELSKGTFA